MTTYPHSLAGDLTPFPAPDDDTALTRDPYPVKRPADVAPGDRVLLWWNGYPPVAHVDSGKWVVVQALKRTRIAVLDTDGTRVLRVRPDHIRKVERATGEPP